MKLSMEVNSLRRCCLIRSKAEVSSCSVAILDKEKENLDKESWKLKFKVRSVEWNGGECGFGWSIYINKRKRRLRLEELGKLGKSGVEEVKVWFHLGFLDEDRKHHMGVQTSGL